MLQYAAPVWIALRHFNGVNCVQCVAACCSVSQSVAGCCSMLCLFGVRSAISMVPVVFGVLQFAAYLQRVAVYCSVLQCVAVCCSVLQCVAVCCSVS